MNALILPVGLAKADELLARPFVPEPQTNFDRTINNFHRLKAFVDSFDGFNLHFFVSRFHDGRHRPTMAWSVEATNDLDEIARHFDLTCRFRPDFGLHAGANGKKPIIGYHEVRPQHMQAAYACIALDKSGLVLIDIDNKTEERLGDKAVAEQLARGNDLPPTFTVATPTDGTHLFYVGQPQPHNVNGLGTSIDVPAMCPAPQQECYGKGAYTIVSALPVAPLPEWVNEELAAKRAARKNAESRVPVGADAPDNIRRAELYVEKAHRPAEGERDSTSYALASRLREFALSEHKTTEVMTEKWLPLCTEAGDWSADDIAKCVQSAYACAQNDFGCDTQEYKMKTLGSYQDPEAEELHKNINPNRIKLMEIQFPDYSTTKIPRPLPTSDNVAVLMKHYGFDARINLMRLAPEMNTPFSDTPLALDDGVGHVADLALRHGFAHTNRIDGACRQVALRNTYHPIREWIDSKPWDGTPRLQELIDSVEERADYPSSLKEYLIRKWCISAVAALYEENFKTRGVLTFIGDQYIGKTSWFMGLAPAGAVLEGAVLDVNYKDSVIAALSRWIVELGEVSSTLKRELASLKAFLTAGSTLIRVPYARTPIDMPRRTVFCATENEEKFLKDETGNSRFYTVFVKSFRDISHLDMQQVWAEVKERYYDAGETWFPSVMRLQELEKINEAAVQPNPIEEIILQTFDHTAEQTERLTATQVLQHCGYNKPSVAELRSANGCLRKHFGKQRKSNGIRFYNMPQPFIQAEGKEQSTA